MCVCLQQNSSKNRLYLPKWMFHDWNIKPLVIMYTYVRVMCVKHSAAKWSDNVLEVKCYMCWAMSLQPFLNVAVCINVLLETFKFFSVSPCTCSLYGLCVLCRLCSSTDWWRHRMLCCSLDVRTCEPDKWKAIACLLYIKPCQAMQSNLPVCR